MLGTKTNKIAKMQKVEVDEHATKNSKKVGGLLSFSMFNAKIKWKFNNYELRIERINK